LSEVSKTTGVTQDILDTIRKDVLYWYPLDINLGGKEHMTVHFPVFLFNHRAILPDEMQPRGIIVNWYITGKKNKISKSKGGAQPIPGAIEEFGVDSMRLYYSNVASMFVDVEWSEDTVISYRQRLDRIFGTVEELLATGSDSPSGEIDEWLASTFNAHIETIRRSMEKYDLRQLTTVAYFEMFNDLKWYVRRGGSNKATIREALRIWITSMMPITPHIAEELWSLSGFDGLVSSAQLPEPGKRSSSAEYGEEFIKNLMSDVAQIKKVANIDAKNIIIYTAPSWKSDIIKFALELKEHGTLDIPSLTKKCMSDENMRKNGKAVSEFAKKVAVDVSRSNSDSTRGATKLDETALLRSAEGFLSTELGALVKVLSADDKDLYDPQNKSKAAVPGRPAVLLE
jgi:leucyl-tRNA synthetase